MVFTTRVSTDILEQLYFRKILRKTVSTIYLNRSTKEPITCLKGYKRLVPSLLLIVDLRIKKMRVLLNRAASSTQLHPPPPSSTQLHPPLHSSFQPPPSSIHLRPAHFSLHPALCNTLNNIWTKILHVIGQFPKFRPKSCPF